MQFALTERKAKITAVNPNRELHGEDPQAVCYIRINIALLAADLAMFHPALRHFIYGQAAAPDLVQQSEGGAVRDPAVGRDCREPRDAAGQGLQRPDQGEALAGNTVACKEVAGLMDRVELPPPPEGRAAHATLPCPDCPGMMALKNSRFGLFYGCENWPRCSSTHGAHPDGKPLGTPADKATKEARIAAHAQFDRLWNDIAPSYVIPPTLARSARKRNEYRIRKRGRTRAYRWLAEQLGIPFEDCHIGAMDAITCVRAASLCSDMNSEKLRDWSKARGL